MSIRFVNAIATTLAFLARASAESRTSAPDGCIDVAKSGGTFSTVQAAVDSLSGASQCIFVGAGTYSEQVTVPSSLGQLTIYGYTEDTSSYSANQVTITASHSQAEGLTNEQTGTLRVQAANFRLYNVDVENAYGEGSQAVALSATADSGYYGCSFSGYQDTVYANDGYQLYAKSLISGRTDFIFGMHASAWFDTCDIRVVSGSIGYITANGRESDSDKSYYVFNSCDIAAASGASVTSAAYYLGRPWREYARVVFQATSMSAVVNGAGWHVWNTGDERTGHVLFGEYANTGSGAGQARADFATQLSSAVAIGSILGSGYESKGFYDGSYL